MADNTKFLPVLLVYNDDEAKKIVRNLKKVKLTDDYQLLDVGVTEYASVPKLDGKAFKYVEKNGQLYLRESVYSMGGLVQDSVLIHLGDFTEGEDEIGEGLSYIARIKDAKAKQRKTQLRECERIAMSTLRQINQQVKNTELLGEWRDELNQLKLFVRLGKEDYCQSQVELISKYAKEDETLAKILVEYQSNINQKNEKWKLPLKLQKEKDTTHRISIADREDIGVINPENRKKFERYYDARTGQMMEYLINEEEIMSELPIAPQILYDKKEDQAKNAEEGEALKTPQVTKSLEKLKRTFTKTNDELEVSR